MRRVSLALAILTALAAAVSAHTPIEIPLDGLEGGYEMSPLVAPDFGFPAQRTCGLVLPENIATVHFLSLVVSGQWTVGEITCNQGGGIYVTSPLLPELIFTVSSDSFPNGCFIASLDTMPEGAFEDLSLGLTSYPPGAVHLDDLIGAELRVDLVVDQALILICMLTGDPFGTLDDVHLEGLATVPVSASTWGGVKALFE